MGFNDRRKLFGYFFFISLVQDIEEEKRAGNEMLCQNEIPQCQTDGESKR